MNGLTLIFFLKYMRPTDSSILTEQFLIERGFFRGDDVMDTKDGWGKDGYVFEVY